MPRRDIARLLGDVIGLDAAALGRSVVDRAIQERQRASGCADLTAYSRLVRRSASELQALIETVVVPETWFFREPAAFSTLTQIVRDPTRQATPLRVLSLPCASGEEPYSIAMALIDAGVAPSRVQIDAIDISRPLLDQARAGRYRRNAFREIGAAVRSHFFVQTAAEYELLPVVRRWVDFQHGNILDPHCLPGAELYDVIFCRNLLIYFDRAAQARAAAVLTRLLKPEGWLFVGSSESAALARWFAPARGPMTCALQKRSAAAESGPRARAGRPTASVVPPRRSPASPGRRRPVVLTPRVADAAAAAGHLVAGERFADAGRLADARQHVERAVREQGPSAQAMYLLGLLEDAAGDRAGAADHYRKALYLDPRHQDALMHLAVLVDRDDAAEARRLRARARRLAREVTS